MDAYTLRKLAPRILIGVIGINLSIYLCLVAIDITNIVGDGLYQLITSPFNVNDKFHDEINLSFGGNLAVGALATLGTIAGASYLLLSSLGTIFLALAVIVLLAIAILIVLAIRQALLVLLTIISPIAIALFIIPNTEKYFRQWWDLFLKTLLVYPIITALFAISNVMATIKIDAVSNGSTGGNMLDIITAILFAFAPLFLIPFAFRFAGGAMSTIMDMARNPSQRLSGFRKQYAQRKRGEIMQQIKEGKRFAGGEDATDGKRGNFRGRWNRRLQSTAIVGSMQAGMNPLAWRNRMQAQRKSDTMSAATRALQENDLMKNVAVNDDLITASLFRNGTEQDARDYLSNVRGQSGRELEQNVAAIRAAKRSVGDKNFRVASAIALAGTKTGYASGGGEMMATINQVAGDDAELARSMTFAARGEASKAQRFDLSEAGAGEYLDGLLYLRQHGNSEAAQQTVTERVADDIIANKGAAYVGAGHSNSVRNLIPALNRRVDAAAEGIQIARASRNPEAVARAERRMKQVLANSANALDAVSSNGNEAAMQIADEHMNHEYINSQGRRVRISDAFEELRSDSEFGQMRREYQNQAGQGRNLSPEERAEIIRRTGADPGSGGPGATPPGGPAGGPPTGPS